MLQRRFLSRLGIALAAVLVVTGVAFATSPEGGVATSDEARDTQQHGPDGVDGGILQIITLATEGNGRAMIMLKEDRTTTSQQFENQLTPVLQQIPDARVAFQNMIGRQGGSGGAVGRGASGTGHRPWTSSTGQPDFRK